MGLITVTLAAMLAATPARLPPVERCTGDASFTAFRAKLDAAVKARDAAALRPLIAPTMTVDFGGGSGWKDFAAAWNLGSNPKASKLWPELAKAMGRGCAHTQDGGRIFPSMFEAMGDELDPFEALLALPGATLREKPVASGKAVARLDWHTARQIEEQVPEDWAAVQLMDGRKGYLAVSEVVSPLDYRLVAEKKGGRWLITAFVAGD